MIYQMTLLTKSEADKAAVKSLITKLGGEVVDEHPLGERGLAYPIKKEGVAQVTLLKFSFEPEGILRLNRELLLSGQTLRHMITLAPTRVRVREKKTAAAPVRPVTEEVEPPAEEAKPAPAGQTKKRTVAERKTETMATKERQKAVEAEIEKLLKEA